MLIEFPFQKKYISSLRTDDEAFMALAYNEAIEAMKHDETPVGAVAVLGNKVIASAHNSVIELNDPSAHAEMLVITKAATAIGDWRLNDVKLYVTKEPCPMCSGAIIMSRIGEVIFGVSDSKMGCLGGSLAMQEIKSFNHTPIVKKGVLEDDCAKLLEYFFEKKRKR